MTIAWTIDDRSKPGSVLVVARHASGEQVVMDADGFTSYTPRAVPLMVLDDLRRLVDQHVDERIDEEAQQ